MTCLLKYWHGASMESEGCASGFVRRGEGTCEEGMLLALTSAFDVFVAYQSHLAQH